MCGGKQKYGAPTSQYTRYCKAWRRSFDGVGMHFGNSASRFGNFQFMAENIDQIQRLGILKANLL